jgi:hypothetical protein
MLCAGRGQVFLGGLHKQMRSRPTLATSRSRSERHQATNSQKSQLSMSGPLSSSGLCFFLHSVFAFVLCRGDFTSLETLPRRNVRLPTVKLIPSRNNVLGPGHYAPGEISILDRKDAYFQANPISTDHLEGDVNSTNQHENMRVNNFRIRSA